MTADYTSRARAVQVSALHLFRYLGPEPYHTWRIDALAVEDIPQTNE